MMETLGLKLLVHTNPEWLARGIGPFTQGSAVHTDVMKTQALRQPTDVRPGPRFRTDNFA